jgi:hypothetical protein
MSMTVARILSEELPTARELPMPPWLYGVIALVLFAFLLGVTWSFRGTAQKYARPNLDGVRPGRAHTGPGGVSTEPAHPEDDEAHWPEHPGHGHS